MYHYRERKETVTRGCEARGCLRPGAYRAPKTRAPRPEYLWFCLDHVREYNKQWDFFAGMSEEEIEAFRKDASFGHRPTWNFQTQGDGKAGFQFRDIFDLFSDDHRTASFPPPPPVPTETREALRIMGLEHAPTPKEIKARYKALVKRFHPDVNRDDPRAEEQFKRVSGAYAALMAHYDAEAKA